MSTPFLLPNLLPCRLATTADVADLAAGAPLTVDGETAVDGDRILVWEQTAADENGIYTVIDAGTGSDGTWVRSNDLPFGSSNILFPGSSIYVTEGSLNGETQCTLVTIGSITIGSTSLVFSQNYVEPAPAVAPEPIYFRATKNGDQATALGVYITVTTWTELDDSHGYFNPTTGIFTAGVACALVFHAAVANNTGADVNERIIRFRKNGVDIGEDSSLAWTRQSILTGIPIILAINDTVELRSNSTAGTGARTYFNCYGFAI